jgi:predicted permease
MPDWRAYVRERLPRLGLRAEREAEIVEELAQQLEQAWAEARACGLSEQEAEAAAAAQIPDWGKLAEEIRLAEQPLTGRLPEAARAALQEPVVPGKERGNMWADLWQDTRYGVRMLGKNPGFALVAVLTLALGIGANTAIFGLLNAVLLRPLPVKDPQELAEVRIVVRKPRRGNFDGRRPEMTYAHWTRLRERQEAFSDIASWYSGSLNLSTSGEDRLASNALWVSGEFFQVFGVYPLLGRTFTAADDERGCTSPGAVLSYGFWQREFGGEAAAVGKRITLNDYPFEVIGVTPADFFGPEVGRQYDLAIPLCADPLVRPEDKRLDRLDGWWLASIGRLKPGWTVERATAQLNAISPALYEETLHPEYDAETAKNYLSLRLGAVPAATGVSGLRQAYSASLWLLLGATGIVLLIACANLANLLLARASAREREIAVRLALGASRRRLVRQMLTESLLVAALGAAAGAWLAGALGRAIVALISQESSPRFLDLGTDWRMVAFLAGLAILTCILFGLAPALRATRMPPAAVMSVGSRGLTDSRERFGLRRLLVVSQIALSLMLLTGALLFGRTLRNLATLDPGFRQDGILQLDVHLRVPVERRAALLEDLLERVRAIPGVDAAASSNYVPLAGNSWNAFVQAEAPGGERKGVVNFDRVSPGYFQTLGVPFLSGRDFDRRDAANSALVAIVNESFARKFFDGVNPVGRTFQVEAYAAGARSRFEIVGLVRDTKYGELREEFGPISYFPARQALSPGRSHSILVRSSLPPAATSAVVKRTLEEAGPGVSYFLRVFKEQVRDTLVQERLMAILTGFFGLLAAVLASVGLYGVLSYTVARRTREIGIRMALGAGRGQVLGMILRESAGLLGVGLFIGAGLTFAAGGATRALLYGLEPGDPLTLSLAALLMAAVVLLASYVPARRAARMDPMAALRYE